MSPDFKTDFRTVSVLRGPNGEVLGAFEMPTIEDIVRGALQREMGQLWTPPGTPYTTSATASAGDSLTLDDLRKTMRELWDIPGIQGMSHKQWVKRDLKRARRSRLGMEDSR